MYSIRIQVKNVFHDIRMLRIENVRLKFFFLIYHFKHVLLGLQNIRLYERVKRNFNK